MTDRQLDIIVGARPNFMKIAPIIRAIETQREAGGTLGYRLVHTGQHYDPLMSDAFFEQLGIPQPDVNLGVGSGTHAEQTAAIMTRYENLLLEQRAALCLVVGDVTSTMACAITAQKLGVPVAHVEAGIRSGDWEMPEEINRLVTDAITNYFFTTSEYANAHLRAAGVGDERIFFVGNTMIDTLLANYDRIFPAAFFTDLALGDDQYVAVTLHRPTNVDERARLSELIHTICDNARGMPVIFPVHPRTARNLNDIGNLPSNLHRVEPQPYLQFIHLICHAKAVITDSGGITEEATVLGVPCMTLRDTTERPETVEQGTNILLGTDASAIGPAFDRLIAGKWHTGRVPPLWDGKAGERIVEHLLKLLI